MGSHGTLAAMGARAGAWRPEATASELTEAMAQRLRSTARRGAVVGVSGGVDSATCAYLARRCCGPRTILVFMPDSASDSESERQAMEVADALGLELRLVDISPALAGLGVYQDLDARVASELDCEPGEVVSWKLVRGPADRVRPVRWSLVGRTAEGVEKRSKELRPDTLRYVVARMNYKQRLRMAVLYSLADEHHHLVIGTANHVELATGFFVRHGDGAGDIFPLGHLFKTEVRSLADELGVPSAVAARASTSDTFSAPQSQEEFFFGLPELHFDCALFGFEAGLQASEVADDLGVDQEVIEATYADLTRRQPFLRWLTLNGSEAHHD
jgi:NAD+ synthase